MSWATRDLGLASYLQCEGEECRGVEIQRDPWDRPIGFFVFDNAPSAETLSRWLNGSARVEPQALLHSMRVLKHTLFKELGQP